jgi:dienelactone hydrolase
MPGLDPDRIGVLGFSMGGGSALLAGERGFIEQLFPRKFRAVVAFYPVCAGRSGIMVAPALILIGALDDWTPATMCQEIVKKADVEGSRSISSFIRVSITGSPTGSSSRGSDILGTG